MLNFDKAFERVILTPESTYPQGGFEVISEVYRCLKLLLKTPTAKEFRNECDVIETHKCTKVICDLGRRWIEMWAKDDEATEQSLEDWFLENLWILVLAIAREIPASDISSSFNEIYDTYGTLKRFVKGFKDIPRSGLYWPCPIPQRWETFPRLQECAEMMFKGHDPAFLVRNTTKIPETYSSVPVEDPNIDLVASQKKNLCSFLAHLTADDVFDFSEVLCSTLVDGLEIARTPEEAYFSRTDISLAKQTMEIAGEVILKHSYASSVFQGTKCDRQRWMSWKNKFLQLGNQNDLGVHLSDSTRAALNLVAKSMKTIGAEWWIVPDQEYQDFTMRESNPDNASGSELESPEPVLQDDYFRLSPRRELTDADLHGSAEIEEHRSKAFGPMDAKASKINRSKNSTPRATVKAQAPRKRKRSERQKASQDGAIATSQEGHSMAPQAPNPLKEERETGPSPGYPFGPNTALPKPKIRRRAAPSKSIRKILKPRDAPILYIVDSRLFHNYLRYRVKWIDIPLEDSKVWYDAEGFEDVGHLDKIQEFHREHPEKPNEQTAQASHDAKNARHDQKWEAKMAGPKAEEGAGNDLGGHVLDEKEHPDRVPADENFQVHPLVQDAQMALQLMAAPQVEPADGMPLDPRLKAQPYPLLPPPAIPQAPMDPAMPPVAEPETLALFSASGVAPDQAEKSFPGALSPGRELCSDSETEDNFLRDIGWAGLVVLEKETKEYGL